MATSYLDLNGLKHLWEKVEGSFSPIDTKAEDIYAEGIGDTVVSGNPVILNDVPYEQDASSLSVSFEPIQDFNGYDYPWPGGGGVNKFDASDPLLVPINAYGFTISIDGEDVVISGTYTGTVLNPQFRILYYSDGRTIPYSAKGFAVDNATAQHFVGYMGKADNDTRLTLILKDCVQGETYTFRIRIVLYEGTTAPTEWTPYSNICPINGLSTIDVKRCGKNLLDGFHPQFLQKGTVQDGDTYTMKQNYATVRFVLDVKSNTTYTASADVENAVSDTIIEVVPWLDGTPGIWNKRARVSADGRIINTFTTTADTKQIRVTCYITVDSENGTKFSGIQLEEGTEATDYEPYTSESYEIEKSLTHLEQGTLNYTGDGSEVSSSIRVRTGFIPIEVETDYISSSQDNGWVIKNGCAYDENKSFLGNGIYPNLKDGKFNTSSFSQAWIPQVKYVRFIYGNAENTDCTPSDYWYQFEKGSSVTPHEIYGGTLDMLSGVLTVDRVCINATSTLGYAGSSQGTHCNVFQLSLSASNLPLGKQHTCISNRFSENIASDTPGRMQQSNTHIYMVINKDEVEYTIASLKTWLDEHPTQFCYELANPITYQLDSHTISLSKGYNYISSDNDIKEITIKFQGKGSSTIQNELSEHEEEIRNINQSISSLTSYDIIADGSGETTLSGNEINISDAIGGNAISLTANVSIGQITEEVHTVSCGSGTCIITPLEDPYSSVDIIVKNGINQTKNTVALGTNVGGGNIDIINGVGIRKYVCGTYSQFGSKGAASIVDAYYISTLPIDLNLIDSCLCNIGTCNPSRILDSNITSPVYGYMEQYPNLFFISFPKSFGISTIELANEFLTQVGGLQIMIPVATPTSFSFTPRNIALFSKNNIITGGRGTELLELTYESSTSSNVQIELNKQNVLLNNIINDIAPVEKSTAIENHAVGDYIILNGKFCKVTTAIATGEIITIGINVSQTTISAEILAILSQ